MAKPKTHFRSPFKQEPRALCRTATTPSFLTGEPDKVTCSYCRKRNLKAIAQVYPGAGGDHARIDS